MTSPRKVIDYTTVARRPRRETKKRVIVQPSVHAKEIELILDLAPPEGVLLPVPPDCPTSDKYRRAIREVVSRLVVPVSPHRYRVLVADTGEILVGCYD